jgi:small conductance mechanosensitive channel
LTQDHVSDLLRAGLEHLAVAAAILFCGYLVALVARALARRWLQRHETALGPSVVRLVSASAFYVLLILATGLSLIALGVPRTFVAGIIVLILIILAVALQERVADLAATVIFLLFRPFKRGELIETLGHLGEVQEILLFNTVLLLSDQRLVTLSNSKIQDEGVTNYSRTGRIRVDVAFTVAYDEDLNRIRAVVREIASNDARILPSPPIEITTDELGDLGVRIQVSPTIAPQDYWDVAGDLRDQIKTRFDTEGIRFATQLRDLAARTPISTHDQSA